MTPARTTCLSGVRTGVQDGPEGGRVAETLDEDAIVMVQARAAELLDLDAAIDRLTALDPDRQAFSEM